MSTLSVAGGICNQFFFMRNYLLEEYYFKLKLIGIYQIIASAIGLAVIGFMLAIFWPILTKVPLTSIFFFVAIIICISAIYFSIGLIKRKQRAIDASVAFQFLQVFSFSYLTYSFSFICGVGIFIIVEFSGKPDISMSVDLASINLYSNYVNYPSLLKINLIPIFLAFYMIRLKQKIKNEEIVSELFRKKIE